MRLLSVLLGVYFSGCAVLHHVQIADLDNRDAFLQVPFDLKFSEYGVDLRKAGVLLDILSKNKNRANEKAAGSLGFIQMGPQTGAPVYSTKWAEQLIYKIYTSCPSGKVTGLTSIRETRDYSAITGEIVRFTGFCLKSKV
jgi:hypothetical protein